MTDNQDKINEIASAHLGKAGDGSVVKPYVTPDNVDPTLLVPVPRSLNRDAYDIKEDSLPFVGYDAWNGYEFSTLLTNGFPISGWLKFVYPSDSPNIVESKSVKLYLNSYNMARLISSVDDVRQILGKISKDFSAAVGAEVQVALHIGDVTEEKPLNIYCTELESIVDVENIKFEHYNESPDILQSVLYEKKDSSDWNHKSYAKNKWFYKSYSLRSNCRVTNQPDWGDVFIVIEGQDAPTEESMLQYIVSMRKENHFHEEVCECIYKRLLDKFKPDALLVACLYTRRGGIDINPVRASNNDILNYYARSLSMATVACKKTARQ